MADVSSVEEVIFADELGFDIVAPHYTDIQKRHMA
jgi:putative N-acetylmannosamine-6-phosphate epimerase